MRVTVETAPALALFMEPGPYARLVTEPLARGVGVGVEPGPGGLTAFWAQAAGARYEGRCPYSPQRFNNGSRFCLQEDYAPVHAGVMVAQVAVATWLGYRLVTRGYL